MTRRDQWQQRESVVRYRKWKDAVRFCLIVAGGPVEGKAYRVKAHFVFEPPPSLLQKSRTRALLQPHTVKPDLDNLAKGLLDALFHADQKVVELIVTKAYGEKAHTQVSITGEP